MQQEGGDVYLPFTSSIGAERGGASEQLVDAGASRGPYNGEIMIGIVPVARVAGLLISVAFIAGGVSFVNGLCTQGMKACLGSSLVCFTVFMAWSLLAARPYPQTYSFAKLHGMHPAACFLYCLYHGTLMAMVTTVLAFGIVSNFVTMKEFLKWSCSGDDDDDSKGLRSGS